VEIEHLVATRQILIICGSGGVGKTTVAAATGVKLAELNHRTEAVVVAELTPGAGQHEEPVPRADFR
jgi:anion-transporting  ArsA/GET3 family ATPase